MEVLSSQGWVQVPESSYAPVHTHQYSVYKPNDLIEIVAQPVEGGNKYPVSNTIASKPMPMPPISNKPWDSQEQEGKIPMNINAQTSITTTTNIEATQRDFVISRIRTVKRDLYQALRDQFHMESDRGPQTAKELVDFIKNDKFVFDDKKLARADEEELRYYNSFYGIIWGTAPDKAGFKVADKALDVRAQEAVDAATLAPVEELQQILKDFQEWKYEAK